MRKKDRQTDIELKREGESEKDRQSEKAKVVYFEQLLGACTLKSWSK